MRRRYRPGAAMTERERLPNRRGSVRFAIRHDQATYLVTLSKFNDGRIAELFLDAEKPDSALAGHTPRRPATITQADLARAIRAAKQAGAAEIEVRVGETSIVIRIEPSTGGLPAALADEREIVL